MKFSINNNIFTYSVIVLSFLLMASCSTDNENPSPIGMYVSIPDAHFEAELIEQGIDSDGVINQKILKTDAEKVTRLDLNLSSHFGEISDLTGIEEFINITFLSAVGQEIQEIDLSSNTALDTLLLSGNSLEKLDIRKNPNLILLDAQSNELTSIKGLSDAKNLKKVNLSFNYFEEFSIDNQSIEALLISHNLLTSIDIEGALNLKNVMLTSNQLTALDLQTNLMLETLLLSDNKLSNIHLEYNFHLTHLYISSNSLTGLDVSRNQKLIDLRADRNPDLTCIKIANSQEIPTVSLSDHQELNTICN
ncbi:MAG: hypothetical protein KDD63_07435 [Bacteroidetes bacterium]|nr:hypothetical protein [Bacteroidota bacterium]